jgi:hypothetical protein
MKKNLLRASGLLALVGVASCGVDTTPVAPSMSATSATRTIAASGSEEATEVSPVLAGINSQLAAAGANVRVVKAELLMKANGWSGTTSTILLANDRARGIGMEWVPGDPRRDGRAGVTYAARAVQRFRPYTLDGTIDGRVAHATVAAHIEEGMQAWNNQKCSSAPMTPAPIAAGTDPDLIDDLVFTGHPSANWVQPADIVHAGFLNPNFFLAIGGASNGPYILGVTFTLNFIDENGNDTDIDHNGKLDIGVAEIYYNPGWFYWTSVARSGSIDFYSVMTHETGHSLGLNHFGKLFVTKHDAADGIQIADIKYAPYAIMNAAYVDGRNEIAGTDRSSFCQIWASAK